MREPGIGIDDLRAYDGAMNFLHPDTAARRPRLAGLAVATLAGFGAALAACPAPASRPDVYFPPPIDVQRPDCGDVASDTQPAEPPITCTGIDCVVSGSVTLHPASTSLSVSAMAGSSTLTVAGTRGFVPGDEVLLLALEGSGAGQYAFRTVQSLSSAGSNLVLDRPIEVSFAADDRVTITAVTRFGSLDVLSTGVISVEPSNGVSGGVLAIRVARTARVAGSIDVHGTGYAGGHGDAGRRACGGGAQGGSPAGAGSVESTSRGGGGGGGGAGCNCCGSSACGSSPGGGGGGHITRGGDGDTAGCVAGAGGEPYDDGTFARMFLGAGGGGGGGNCDNASPQGARGGGILFLATDALSLHGTLDASGAAADSAIGWFYQHWEGSGGSGAGGTILVSARTIETTPTARLLARGGASNRPCGSNAGAGGAGGDGLVRIECETLDGAACATAHVATNWEPVAQLRDSCTPRATCDCPGGFTRCDRACVDTLSDSTHCGSCGVACAPGQVCERGTCVGRCSAGRLTCSTASGGAACIDPTVDRLNCGACGNACLAGEACMNGQCVCATGTRCDASCVDLGRDPLHCGACDHACPSGSACVGGTCGDPCGGGPQISCRGTCVDWQYDSANCGCCNNVCGTAQSCSDGVCVGPCGENEVLCGTTCVVLAGDTNNCGACGRSCGADPLAICVNSECACFGGDFCGGRCVSLMTDRENCGVCGTHCARGASCSGGVCACGTGETVCGDTCADLSRDVTHCGACATACSTGETCVGGSCQCTSSRTRCSDGSCADTASDANHCGNCATRCPAGSACVGGGCTT